MTDRITVPANTVGKTAIDNYMPKLASARSIKSATLAAVRLGRGPHSSCRSISAAVARNRLHIAAAIDRRDIQTDRWTDTVPLHGR